MTRKLFSIAISLLYLFYFAACSPPSKVHKDPYTLTESLSSDPITLNPVLIEDAYSSAIAGRIYESLLERDNVTLGWKGLLAERWTISSDHKTYTFYLRKGVKFQDGELFTSKDVVYTFHKMMDPSVPNPSVKVYYNNVESIAAQGDYIVVFKTKKPFYETLVHLGGFSILPEHIFSKVDNFVNNEYNLRKPVGTGPYIFYNWQARQKVVLLRNEKYWRKLPEIRRIEFKIMEDSSVALMALKKRELDLLNLTPFQWTRQSNSEKFNESFNKIKYTATSYRYIGYNTKKFPFNDIRVRVAMTHLVDRQKILEKLMENLAVITTGNFWIESPQYNQSLKPHRYDPERARALLKEAGYSDSDGDGFLDLKGAKLTFELLIPSGSEFYQRFAPVVKEDMAKAGVDMQIRQLQFQALVEKMNKREFEALMLGWSMSIENDPYQLWHSSQIEKGHNFTGFTTPEMDHIIEQARMEFDEIKRNKMYHRFHEILHDNQPYTFLFTSKNLLALDKRFTSVNVYKTGVDMMEWKIKPIE